MESNIYPREVEEGVADPPAGRGACGQGARPGRGARSSSFVVTAARVRRELDVHLLDAHCPVQKRPKRYIFIDELPKSSTASAQARTTDQL